MNSKKLIDTTTAIFAEGKGLLAMDESNPPCNKRFAPLGIPQTEASRRAYRELIITSPGLRESISGAILCDESIRQKTSKGTAFVEVLVEAGIIPGPDAAGLRAEANTAMRWSQPWSREHDHHSLTFDLGIPPLSDDHRILP